MVVKLRHRGRFLDERFRSTPRWLCSANTDRGRRYLALRGPAPHA
jgi:hypothetical protein